MACQYNNQCTSPGVLITYTLTPADLNLTDLYSVYTSWSNSPAYKAGETVPKSEYSESIVAPCDIPFGFNGAMIAGMLPIINGFNISPSRVCNFNVVTTPVDPNVTKTLTAITFSLKLTDINLKSPPLLNDYLPAGILKSWITDWLKAYNASNPSTYTPTLQIPPKYLEGQDFTPLYYKSPSYSPSYSHFSGSVLNIEKYSGVASTTDPGYSMKATPKTSTPTLTVSNKNASPSTLWEYIFQFAFGMSFLGAIFLSTTSTLNMNPADIIVNKNMLIFLNVFIAASGIVSIFVWFNMNNPVLVNTALNPATVKTQLF